MSHEQTPRPPLDNIKSVPMGGAMKAGILFPFLMDKEKAQVFGLHMLFMVLSVMGLAWVFGAPFNGSIARYVVGVPLCLLVGLGTMVLTSVYAMQRMALGNAVCPYLDLIRTPYFTRTTLFMFIYHLLYFGTLALAGTLPLIGLVIYIGSIYVFIRLELIFPDAATREVANFSDGWRFAKGYVFEIFWVRLVISLCFYILAFFVLAFWSGPLFALDKLSLDALETFDALKAMTWSIPFGTVFWAGILVGIISWLYMSAPAALGRLYKEIMADREAREAFRAQAEAATRKTTNTSTTGEKA